MREQVNTAEIETDESLDHRVVRRMFAALRSGQGTSVRNSDMAPPRGPWSKGEPSDTRDYDENLPNAAPPPANRMWPRYVQLVDGAKNIWSAVEEIRYLQADQKHTRVYLRSSSGLIRQSLHVVYGCLDRNHFWEIHRGTIVHIKYIEDVMRDDLGRLSVKMHERTRRLLVAKGQEHLFRQNFVGLGSKFGTSTPQAASFISGSVAK